MEENKTMYFNRVLMNEALELLDTVKDLSESSKDFEELERIFKAYNSGYFPDYAYITQLDKNLRQKYIEISLMVAAAEAINWITPKTSPKALSTEDPYISNLRQDAYGILAHALLKSGKIVKIAEFFDESRIKFVE